MPTVSRGSPTAGQRPLVGNGAVGPGMGNACGAGRNWAGSQWTEAGTVPQLPVGPDPRSTVEKLHIRTRVASDIASVRVGGGRYSL